MPSAELIIIPPTSSAHTITREFLGKCILYGIDFHFTDNDTLPASVPSNLTGVRAIIHDDTTNPGDPKLLDHYRSSGAKVYVLSATADPAQPNARPNWRSPFLLDMLTLDAGLTLHHPQLQAKLTARDDNFLFDSLGGRLQESVDTRWYDATRYQWEGLLDGYELTGDQRYFDSLQSQITTALSTPNPLDNCDTIAPFLPILRFHDLQHSSTPSLPSAPALPPSLLPLTRTTIDRYLDATPRHAGCLVNFNWLSHTVRSEIIWQVCPTLAWLSKVTGDSRYLAIALDQFDRLSARLLDPKTGLWHHGVGDRHHTAAFWARGCAFVLLGLVHLSEHAPTHPALRETILKMAETLCQHQDASGFWYTVIDQPDTEFESSGTAWIGAALERGKRLKILPATYRDSADRAWSAVKSRIWQGHFPGHNTATTVSPHREYYLKSQLSTTGWSHFAFRLACEKRRTATAF